jgi:hypothetical protein
MAGYTIVEPEPVSHQSSKTRTSSQPKPVATPKNIAKTSLRTLVKAVESMAIAAAIPISRLRGIALADMQRDALITTLGPFGAAEAAVVKVPDFATRFGVAEGGRFVLQFVYEYFGRVGNVAYDWKVFDRVWHDFATEVQDANWVHRGIANIRNF